MASTPKSFLKRPRGTPTKTTPQRPPKRTALHERISEGVSHTSVDSTPAERETAGSWTEAEIKALVEFVLFHEKDDK